MTATDLYQNHYAAIRFERQGLFQLVQKQYGCKEALYPGSSVHITPSFYIPHVVYIDISNDAAQFFSNQNAVIEYINQHKKYKRRAFLQFLHQDYTQALPIQHQFDLLIALFAPQVIHTSTQYIKKNGLVLVHTFQNNLQDAVNNPELRLESAVQFTKNQYQIIPSNNTGIDPFLKSRPSKKYLKQHSNSVDYVENEMYFIFKKI